MSPGRDRRTRRPLDVLLRAFLQRRRWRGGRRALLDALPDGGRLAGLRDLADTLDRIGFRCTWRFTIAALVRADEAPAVVATPLGPVLLTGIGPNGARLHLDPRTPDVGERPLPGWLPVRVLSAETGAGDRRTSLRAVWLGEATALSLAIAASVGAIAFAGFAPVLGRDAASGSGFALAALAALAVAALAGRGVRDRLLAGIATRIETRLTGLAVERALFAPAGTIAAPRAFRAAATLQRGGALGAAFDALAIPAACLGALAIGGAGSIAPLFAAMALALLLSVSRARSRDLIDERADDEDLLRLRRADRTSGLIATGRSISACVAALLLVLWANDRGAFADLVGLATALAVCVHPLLALLAADADLADAAQAGDDIRRLASSPVERARLSRIAVHAPATIEAMDLAAQGPAPADGAIHIGALRIEPGEAVAFFGPPGSGATAIAAAIAGLVPVERGRLVVGGRDLSRTDLPAFRAEIGYASADLVFPSMPALDLVRRLAPFSGEAAAMAAFEQCGLRTDGLDPETVVSADCAPDLRLRLSLAGALARRPPLLVLAPDGAGADEALARLLTDQVQRLRGLATIVLATGATGLLAGVDRAFVIDRGRLVGMGPPDRTLAVDAPAVRRFAASHRVA